MSTEDNEIAKLDMQLAALRFDLAEAATADERAAITGKMYTVIGQQRKLAAARLAKVLAAAKDFNDGISND